MTAKQLIKAAKRVIANIPTRDSKIVADHILATVHPDDDEPVTVERMDKEPGFRRARLSDPLWHRVGIDFAVAVWDEKAFASGQCLSSMSLKSMGHLRRLIAALEG